MNRKVKKYLRLLTSFFILLSMIILSFSTTYAESNSITNIDDQIIRSLIQTSKEPGVTTSNGEIVESSMVSGNKAYIVRKQDTDGVVQITTIVPLTYLPSGSLVNSFNYFENNDSSINLLSIKNSSKKNTITPEAITVPVNFTDVTVTTITYEAYYLNYITYDSYYRHAGNQAKWNSSYSNVSVSYMYVTYCTRGELSVYPDCLNISYRDPIQDQYTINSWISKSSPAKDTIYSDSIHLMPINRVVSFWDFMNDYDFVYVELRYYDHNGNYHDCEDSFGLHTP